MIGMHRIWLSGALMAAVSVLVPVHAESAPQATQSPQMEQQQQEQQSLRGTIVTVDPALNRIMIREEEQAEAQAQAEAGAEGEAMVEPARHQVLRVDEQTEIVIDGEQKQLADLQRDDQVTVEFSGEGVGRTVSKITVQRDEQQQQGQDLGATDTEVQEGLEQAQEGVQQAEQGLEQIEGELGQQGDQAQGELPQDELGTQQPLPQDQALGEQGMQDPAEDAGIMGQQEQDQELLGEEPMDEQAGADAEMDSELDVDLGG